MPGKSLAHLEAICHDIPAGATGVGATAHLGDDLKNLPHWARLLLIIIAVVVATGLILPYFLDVDRYRSFVATLIETKTGRKVRIGKIRARLLPSVGFVVEDFGLRNPPGFAEGDVLSAQAIRGNLAWGPLLHREFRLSSVELVRPKFMLLENDLGQTNYGSSPRLGPGAAEKSGLTLSQPPSETAGIDRVELTDAEVILARLAPKARDAGALIPTVHASRIRAELSHLVFDPLLPKQWEAHANLSGVTLELPGWKGPITFRSGQLQLRNGAIESEFRVSLGKAADFQGTLHVADIEHGVAAFELSTPQLDVDEALRMQEKTPPPHSSIPRPRQSELVAKGRLSAEHVRWKPYAASKATAEVRIFSDRVELWPVGLELYGGMLQISARAERTQKPERFSSNVQVRNLNMGELLAASPATRGKLSGTGELNLQLFGWLDNDWQKSLSGTGQLAIRDGRLPGINLTGALESASKLAGMSGETPFSVIQADLTISQRRISSRQIHLDSPHGTADLHGSCSLDGALEYDGQAVWAPGAAAGGQGAAGAVGAILGGVLRRDIRSVTVPIAIRGTLQDPKFYPGRGAPRIQSPSPQPGLTPGQKDKGILDIFRRP